MESDFFFGLTRMFSALAIVLGIMFGLLYVAKRTIWKGAAPGSGAVPIRVLGQRSLGAKKSIAVVEVEGHRMILGLTSERISLLGGLEGDGSGAAEYDRTVAPETGRFPKMLAGLLRRGGGVEGDGRA